MLLAISTVIWHLTRKRALEVLEEAEARAEEHAVEALDSPSVPPAFSPGSARA